MRNHAMLFRILPVIVLAWALGTTTASACTGITVKAKDGSIVFARTMEFGVNLKSDVIAIPRGMKYKGTAPKDGKALEWTVKYGVVGANAYGLPIVADGMNEKGLHVGTFLLPGFTKYQDVPPEATALAPLELPTWLLGTCSTVGEAIAAVKKVRVWSAPIPGFGDTLPVHFAFTDTSGESAVIQYVDGKLRIYDNPLGVITNSPPFDWHLINLGNYVNLSATNVKPMNLKVLKVSPIGQGSGMLGLPGDITPPSRFVRGVAYTNTALPVEDAQMAVKQAIRILDSFYIVKGYSRDDQGKTIGYDHTQWSVASDLARKAYYFCDYNDLAWNVVDLMKIDFSGDKIRKVGMGGNFFKDVSGQMQ